MGTEVSVIPKLRKVLYGTYAYLIAFVGAIEGDLGYATDHAILYRYDGAAWDAITSAITATVSGLIADLPAARFVDGVVYHATDGQPALKRTKTAGAWVAVMDNTTYIYVDCTLAEFQANPAAGTCTSPASINDNNVVGGATFDAIDETAEINMALWRFIDQWRDYGDGANIGDGTATLQYWGIDAAWHDWVTGILTRDATWRAMQTATEVFCSQVRMVCTAVDSSASFSRVAELEVYHS